MEVDMSSDCESCPDGCYIARSKYKKNSKIWKNTNQLFKLFRKADLKKDRRSGALITAGCDVNATDKRGRTLLHLAVQRSTVIQAEALLKQGADVNALTLRNETPLFLAARFRRPDKMICMLLHYEAHVTIPDVEGRTAFTTGFARIRTRHMLLDFHNKDDTALMLSGSRSFFGRETSQVLMRLIEDGASVNRIDDRGNSPLIYSITEKNVSLFKLIWPKVNHTILTKFHMPLLWLYILPSVLNADYTPPEWLECLYLMLGSDAASVLIADTKARSKCGSCVSDFFKGLLWCFRVLKVDSKDRIALIYLLFSLDATIHMECIDLVHRDYGYGEELEAVLHCAGFCKGYPCIYTYNKFSFPMAYIFCATKEDPSREKIVEYFKCEIGNRPDRVALLLGYFSLSLSMKYDLLVLVPEAEASTKNKISEKLDCIPNVPSLVELSRNQTRTYIQRKFNIKKPHQFYYVVKCLPIPKKIEDIICFKQALY